MRFKLYEFYVGNRFYIVDEYDYYGSPQLSNMKDLFSVELTHTPHMNHRGDKIIAEANTIEELKMKVLEYII